MGSTDRITPHVFQDPYLATDSSIVDGRPQRTEIVVIANGQVKTIGTKEEVLPELLHTAGACETLTSKL